MWNTKQWANVDYSTLGNYSQNNLYNYKSTLIINFCCVFLRKMPKKNIKEHLWNEENMQEAVNAVLHKKMEYLLASKRFSVPRTTLFRYCEQKRRAGEIKLKKWGRSPILTEALEKELVDHLLEMEKNFFGLTRRDVRNVAFQLAVKNNLPHKENWR